MVKKKDYSTVALNDHEGGATSLLMEELLQAEKTQRHLAERIKSLEKAQVDFESLPKIFHQLKNNLTPILGYAQILLNKIEDDQIRRRVQKIEKNAQELTDLLTRLKEHFGVPERPKEWGDLNDIIQNVRPGIEREIAGSKVELTYDLEPQLLMGQFDSAQVEVLIECLTQNAVRAVAGKQKNPARIKVKSNNRDGRAWLTVSDNGIGISEADLPYVWKPFFQRFETGAGLGLTLCEWIISQHDAIWNINVVQGELTEFEVGFKTGHPGSEVTGSGWNNNWPDDHVTLKHKKILFFGLNDPREKLIRDFLFDRCLVEPHFINDKKALQTALKPEGCDLLVIDWDRYPGNKSIAEFEPGSHPSGGSLLFLLDGTAETETKQELLKAGLDWLEKPFSLMGLMNRIFGIILERR